MSTTTDSTSIPNEHYEILQMDLVKRGLPRRAADGPGHEEASLRDFNAELLTRIGDFRKKNLEIARSENALRMELANAEKREREREQELVSGFEKEIEQLKRSLNEATVHGSQASEEWSRRLTKLTDEKWELELEIENLKKKDLEQADSIQRMMSELEAAGQRETAQADEFKREHQKMTQAYEALRKEYENVDACYRHANDSVLQLRNEIHSLTARYESALVAQQEKMKADFKLQGETVFNENAQLRSMLSLRDMKLEADRSAVQTLRERLTYLDQHLAQVSERVKREKLELSKVSKSISEELQFALEHPFTEYLEIAERELQQIEKQLSATSNMAPHRGKLEARLNEARSHRDGIKAILSDSESELARHRSTVAGILDTLSKEAMAV